MAESPRRWSFWHGFDEPPEEKKKIKDDRRAKKGAATESGDTQARPQANIPETQHETTSTEQQQESVQMITQQEEQGTENLSQRAFEGALEEKVEPELKKLLAFGDQEQIERMMEGVDDITKKDELKEQLRQIKYAIQGYDAERVKESLEKTKYAYTPKQGNRNKYWGRHDVRTAYNMAWVNLALWGKSKNTEEKKVWDENDQYGFRRETWPKEGEHVVVTERLGNIEGGWPGAFTEGLLRGGKEVLKGGKFAALLPWKGFEMALKYTLPYFLDGATTNKMLTAMFGKKEKKEKKPEKKETWVEEKKPTPYEKAHAEKMKLKGIEEEYMEDLKGSVALDDMERKKFEESEEYTNLATNEERAALIAQKEEEKGKETYHKAWFDFRIHWVAQQGWTAQSEEKFRASIGLAPNTEGEYSERDLYLYFMTRSERDSLDRAQRTKDENEKKRTPQEISDEERRRLEEENKDVKDEMEEIKDKIGTNIKTARRFKSLQRRIERNEARLQGKEITEDERKRLDREIEASDRIMRRVKEDATRRASEKMWPPYESERLEQSGWRSRAESFDIGTDTEINR